MIIFVHGFGSSSYSTKATQTKEYFKNKEIVLAPSLPYVPHLAIKTLEEIIEYVLLKEDVHLIGSSLGGFYAIYLSNKYNIKSALVNPAVYADERLGLYRGMATNYYDGSKFEWCDSHIKELKELVVDKPKEEKFLLMLQKGDEVLDYKEALKKLPNSTLILEDGGDHSFTSYKKHLNDIDIFFNGSN